MLRTLKNHPYKRLARCEWEEGFHIRNVYVIEWYMTILSFPPVSSSNFLHFLVALHSRFFMFFYFLHWKIIFFHIFKDFCIQGLSKNKSPERGILYASASSWGDWTMSAWSVLWYSAIPVSPLCIFIMDFSSRPYAWSAWRRASLRASACGPSSRVVISVVSIFVFLWFTRTV